ncbi:dolichol-phosphate mannosyltransferase [Andreprevotia lacus DSM 23236]|jgi:dolichol-phosphate mannosyltransferase|uniref:Dolichol-phosphate mannosyltransferase n=1 Tax=Andreprevotia lacus DSM 23236 TaxID=1121001 RepID=A0A1W1XR96_9NEIS|nr:glycosyltransferase family 2 protein [Andreprevotia lacus]SMC26510.1 dolichol-phosphate mannosyltransferase [Andreprevotia lacus DSM 23236]
MGRLISIVMPVYHEGPHIEASVRTVHALLNEHAIEHEFVLIDDGSRDNSWEALQQLSHDLPGIHALRLSRNFGKEAALCAGLERAGGDAVVVMDSDLQHPPSCIPEMVKLWREGWDVVEGVKASRGRESGTYKLGAHAFYKLFHKLSGFDLRGASDFKLMDRRAVEAWQSLKERDTFFRGMSAWVGFKRYRLPFEVAPRTEGVTKWSPWKLGKLFISAITSFSALPLQMVTVLGGLFFVASLAIALQTLYMKFSGHAFSGFTTVILLQLIIGSSLMFSLGIIGTYLARIYDEVKGRPRYLVSEEAHSSSTD